MNHAFRYFCLQECTIWPKKIINEDEVLPYKTFAICYFWLIETGAKDPLNMAMFPF